MPECRICNTAYHHFISFGEMPIANGFLLPEEFESEYTFQLKVGFCMECLMVQLTEQPDKELMFHENYAYFSSISTRMAAHFEDFAACIKAKQLTSPEPFVVEIGSNDGIMLQHFKAADIRHLGIEPSNNVADAARRKGINTISVFFDEEIAEKVVNEYGQADAVLAANVMCHIPYLHSVAAGIHKLLKPKGVFVFEDPYLGDIIEKTSYDQIYDEHVFYFSIASVRNLFDRHGLEVIDVIPQTVHGGSMRYFIGHKGEHSISQHVENLIVKENRLGLRNLDTFEKFSKNVRRSRDMLREALYKFKAEGLRVAGYGATSKSTTVTNYCGITPDLVEYISDTTPTKQGKYSPGAHIPIRPYNEFEKKHPDCALLFAWNHGEEIMEKEKKFKQNGGKWLLYVPEVKVI